MKRLVNFQEKDEATAEDWKFSDSIDPSTTIRSNKRQKGNGNKDNKIDRASIKAKRSEMLNFRKQLPIYSGTINTIPRSLPINNCS